jgi:translation initiation factor IF-1
MIRKAAQPSKAWTAKRSVDGRLKWARLALKKIGPHDPGHVHADSGDPRVGNICNLRSSSHMPSESDIAAEGKIIAILPGTMFRVELDNNHIILAHISGKMRKRFIRLNLGDRVKLEMSPYDLGKGRIVYRIG